MMQRIFEKILCELEELKRVEESRIPNCNKEGFGDGEQIYNDGKSQGRYEQTKKIIKIIKQMASEHGDGWIPVSSGKLPEVPEGKDYVNVLITKQYTSSTEVIPTEYYEEDGFNDYEKSLITAWRYDYMPEPYKAESEE